MQVLSQRVDCCHHQGPPLVFSFNCRKWSSRDKMFVLSAGKKIFLNIIHRPVEGQQDFRCGYTNTRLIDLTSRFWPNVQMDHFFVQPSWTVSLLLGVHCGYYWDCLDLQISISQYQLCLRYTNSIIALSSFGRLSWGKTHIKLAENDVSILLILGYEPAQLLLDRREDIIGAPRHYNIYQAKLKHLKFELLKFFEILKYY